MKALRSFTAGSVVLLALSVTALASAKATNADLFHMGEMIEQELLLILEANGTDPHVDETRVHVAERRPRHVIQKAREVLIKIEEVKGMHDMAEREVPEFPVREVHPDDINEFLENALEDVRSLRGAYGVAKPSAAATKPADKSATEIYEQLQVISLQLDGLGIPPVRDYTVYRIALSVVADLDHIWDAKGLTGKTHLAEHATGKTPAEVYVHALELLAEVKTLTEQPGYAIPGGVVMPNPRSGEITASHVMEVMHYVLAEVNAVKLVLGVMEPTEFALPHHSDVFPSNIYDTLTVARQMIQTLETGS